MTYTPFRASYFIREIYGERRRGEMVFRMNAQKEAFSWRYFLDDLVKSLLGRHPGESRGPEQLEMTGFRLSPE
jgi:hypothetical protein